MTNSIYPCLWFDNQAKEAAEFYCSIFKQSKIVNDTPMVARFELNGKLFMGLNGGPMFKFNPSISFVVTCETIDETNELWNKLIDGGKALMAIDKYAWSDRYGWLEDKFGLTWQISIANNNQVKRKITPGFLFTDQKFGKAEAALNFYSSIFDNSSTQMLVHYPKEHEYAGKTMYAEFKLNGHDFIAMDGPGNHNYSFNEALSFVVECDTQQQIDYYWGKLTVDGGQESQCGWLKDKFGVSWQIVPSILGSLMSDPEKAGRVVNAFMQMKKFDIDTLVKAANNS